MRYNLKVLPLFIALLLLPGLAGAVKEKARVGTRVSFTTSDGVKISALFRPPAGKNRKTIVLLHGLASNQEEWQPFIRKLVQAGYGFLSYDARGHGESTVTAGGQPVSFERFGAPGPGSPWSKMPADLKEAVNFLVTVKGINANKIGLAGASLGANVCLVYAAENPSISPVILLSPGLNYAGIDAAKAVSGLTNRSVLFAASPGDSYAFQSSHLLYQQIQSNKRAEFLTGDNNRHGVQMFDGKFENKLLKWLNRH